MSEKKTERILQELIEKARIKKVEREAGRDLYLRQLEEDRNTMMQSVGESVGAVLTPYVEQLLKDNRLNVEELRKAWGEAVVAGVPNIDVHVPEVVVPPFSNS
jgi:hypothetical protein